MPKDQQALALLTAKSAPVHFSKDDTSRVLLDKLAALARYETQAGQLGLQIGVLLWQAKAALPHGAFQPWVKENIAGKSYRSCAYYMKLALIFTEKVKPAAWKIEAMMTLDLDAKQHTDEELSALDTMKQFIGENSLTELLIKYGIKGVGLKSELAGEESAPLSAEQQQQQELALIWEQTYAPAKTLADLLTEKCAALSADQRGALEVELTRALDALRRV